MKYLWSILGFLMLAIGLCSLILHAMGLQFSFLSPLNNLSGMIRFIVHLVLIFAGVVLMYLNLSDWRNDYTRDSA